MPAPVKDRRLAGVYGGAIFGADDGALDLPAVNVKVDMLDAASAASRGRWLEVPIRNARSPSAANPAADGKANRRGHAVVPDGWMT
jgi:hypothetical protein